jgi:hypothetical protein
MTPVSPRLDWITIWQRYDIWIPEVRGHDPAGFEARLAVHVSPRARLEIRETDEII